MREKDVKMVESGVKRGEGEGCEDVGEENKNGS